MKESGFLDMIIKGFIIFIITILFILFSANSCIRTTVKGEKDIGIVEEYIRDMIK